MSRNAHDMLLLTSLHDDDDDDDDSNHDNNNHDNRNHDQVTQSHRCFCVPVVLRRGYFPTPAGLWGDSDMLDSATCAATGGEAVDGQRPLHVGSVLNVQLHTNFR